MDSTVADMSILFVTNELCLDHFPGDKHPEQPDRLSTVLSSFQKIDFKDSVIEVLAEPIEETMLFDVHGEQMIKHLKDIHANDIAMILDQHNVAIRTGHHCAQPLLKKLNLESTARASFGIYNNKNDVDFFIEAIIEAKKFFKQNT